MSPKHPPKNDDPKDADNNQMSLVEELYKSKAIKANMFSLNLKKKSGGNSYIHFGGY